MTRALPNRYKMTKTKRQATNVKNQITNDKQKTFVFEDF